MSSNIVISANNISKGYVLYEKPHHCLKRIISSYFTGYDGNISNEPINNQFLALKNVSMNLRKNETLGIIGQNGSGKSTLLQIICGTLSPSSGSTKTQGKVAALLELGAGFNPEYTGRENVYLNASMYGLSAKDIEEK